MSRNFDRSTAAMTRRGFLGAASAVGAVALGGVTLAGTASPAAASSATAQKIADHFSTVKSMTGESVPFVPKGEQTGGKFFMERPGKIRFNYEQPSSFRVVSDGESVVILNRKMNTSDLYPLSKTPLKLLLDERIDVSGDRVRKVIEDDDLTTIVMSDKQVFGNAGCSRNDAQARAAMTASERAEVDQIIAREQALGCR